MAKQRLRSAHQLPVTDMAGSPYLTTFFHSVKVGSKGRFLQVEVSHSCLTIKVLRRYWLLRSTKGLENRVLRKHSVGAVLPGCELQSLAFRPSLGKLTGECSTFTFKFLDPRLDAFEFAGQPPLKVGQVVIHQALHFHFRNKYCCTCIQKNVVLQCLDCIDILTKIIYTGKHCLPVYMILSFPLRSPLHFTLTLPYMGRQHCQLCWSVQRLPQVILRQPLVFQGQKHSDARVFLH